MNDLTALALADLAEERQEEVLGHVWTQIAHISTQNK